MGNRPAAENNFTAKNGYYPIRKTSNYQYERKFENNEPTPQGKITKLGRTFEGQIERNGNSVKGTITMKDGSIYQGEVFDVLRNGKGVMFYQNGSIYNGSWHHDKRHGYGTLTIGNKIIKGNWFNDFPDGDFKIVVAIKRDDFTDDLVKMAALLREAKEISSDDVYYDLVFEGEIKISTDKDPSDYLSELLRSVKGIPGTEKIMEQCLMKFNEIKSDDESKSGDEIGRNKADIFIELIKDLNKIPEAAAQITRVTKSGEIYEPVKGHFYIARKFDINMIQK